MPRPANAFVGRVGQLDWLRSTLAEHRLVTLFGVGGAGKTRLAYELAARIEAETGQDVRVVNLLAVPVQASFDLLLEVVMRALDVPDQTPSERLRTLLDWLVRHPVLLVLDNCEHIVDLVQRLVPEILEWTGDTVRIVATSRERLQLPGEVLVKVPPLAVPPPDTPVSRWREYDAAVLLHERATASVPDWTITERDWPHLQRVLKRAEGIPLLIEALAFRLLAMPAKLLADRLDAAFGEFPLRGRRTPAGMARHDTPFTLLNWSFQRCTPVEQLLWARLSVFAGSMSWDAAVHVGTGDDLQAPQVEEAITGLVDKSVLDWETPSRARLQMLETYRDFGRRHLRESGATEETWCRYSGYFRHRLTELADQSIGEDELAILDSVEADIVHYRLVFASLVEAPGEELSALKMAIDLMRTRWPTYANGLAEARLWLRRALKATSTARDPLRAAALALDAYASVLQGGDPDETRDLLEAASSELPEGATSPPLTFGWGTYRALTLGQRDGVEELRLVQRQLAESADASEGEVQLATVLLAVGSVTALHQDSEQAWADVVSFDRSTERLGGPWIRAWVNWCRAVWEIRWGDPDNATTLLRDPDTMWQTNERWTRLWATEALGWAEAQRGAAGAAEATRQLACAERMRDLTGHRISGLAGFTALREVAVSQARAHLGDAEFARLSQATAAEVDEEFAGRQRRPSKHHPKGQPSATTDDPGAGGSDADATNQTALTRRKSSDDDRRRLAMLTPAQREVARLVAAGRKNPEIAEELTISPRTVATHLSTAYRRLSLSNEPNPRHELVMMWIRAFGDDVSA